MSNILITNTSPFSLRFKAWIDERFPIVNYSLFVLLYITTVSVAWHSTGYTPTFSGWDLFGCLLVWSYFLLLRIFDEHKDYELDCIQHPQRVLQRGLITLHHLKVMGAIALILQIGGSIWLDGGIGSTTLAWGLLFAWTCLMGKEFFIPEWLNRHLTWYAISHMVVMLFLVWWIANLTLPNVPFNNSIAILMGQAFLSGFCYEITRKVKGPDEDRPDITTYSQIFGIKGALLILAILLTAMFAVQLYLVYNLINHIPLWSIPITGLIYLLSLYQLANFLRHPSMRERKRNEMCVGLFTLVIYAVITTATLSNSGFIFS